MRPLIEEVGGGISPEELLERTGPEPGFVLLRSCHSEASRARYSFVAAHPFLTFESFGSKCRLTGEISGESYGNPWALLSEWMARYELPDQPDVPFPTGGCFGFWGYDLKNFVEPRLPRRSVRDLELPDCRAGFYSSLVVFDHWLGRTWIVSTGLQPDGNRSRAKADEELREWRRLLRAERGNGQGNASANVTLAFERAGITSNTPREQFVAAVRRAQEYIRAGDIYQVNLAHRLCADWPGPCRDLFLRLKDVSPAPYAAYLHCGEFELASSSPEMFLRMSGSHIKTRPIKGTRPRHPDATRDAQLAYELQTSAKEISELVMITDLLRNDLGRVCEYGSIQVPDLVRLEKFAQVQHLVSTVEGRLRPEVTHFQAFSSCFPGGSITGAPKIRAMEIIDELEPVSRGPYTGALGYLGFNRESQLSIIIRTAVCTGGRAYFHVGAGIVADSSPEAEYEETIAKARGFIAAAGATADHFAPAPAR